MPVAAVMPGPNRPVELREFSSPAVEPGAVLLQTLYSEVCGTDVHLQHGRLAGVPYPIIPGHVAVGEVREVSGRVFDIDGNAVSVGDRVTYLDVHETCNHCWFCLVAKQTTRCPSRKGLRHHLFRRRWLAGRLERTDLFEAGCQDPAT